MTKEIFLQELREALRGEVPASIIQDNLNYYETYILQEIRKGRTEQEVLERLGNPRILAQTIIDTSGVASGRATSNYRYSDNGGEHGRYGDRDEERTRYTHSREFSGRKAKMVLWVTIAAIILVIIGVIALIAGIISIIAPILVPLLLIALAIRIINRR